MRKIAESIAKSGVG